MKENGSAVVLEKVLKFMKDHNLDMDESYAVVKNANSKLLDNHVYITCRIWSFGCWQLLLATPNVENMIFRNYVAYRISREGE